jgi:hypothetical protein
MDEQEVLKRVRELRYEIALLRDMNEKSAGPEQRTPLATRARGERSERLEEIKRELAALAEKKQL